MQNQEDFLQGLGVNERREFFENNAAEIYQGKYSRPLTEDEVVDAKDKLSDSYIKLSDLEADFEEKKVIHKEKVKPFKIHIGSLAVEIRTRQRFTVGTVYSLANHHTGYMENYNEFGKFLSSRKLRPDEKQAGLFTLPQTGTGSN